MDSNGRKGERIYSGIVIVEVNPISAQVSVNGFDQPMIGIKSGLHAPRFVLNLPPGSNPHFLVNTSKIGNRFTVFGEIFKQVLDLDNGFVSPAQTIEVKRLFASESDIS